MRVPGRGGGCRGVINRGKLVATGALEALQHAGVTVRAAGTDHLAQVLMAAGGIVEPRGDGSLMVRGLTCDDVGDRAFAAGIPLHELATGSGSLEELFLGWTGDQTNIKPIGLRAAMPV